MENHNPSYRQRLEQACQLNLQEHQVQVWFKNHDSKVARLSRNQVHYREPRVSPEPVDLADQRPALVAPQLEVPQLEAPEMEAHQLEGPCSQVLWTPAT